MRIHVITLAIIFFVIGCATTHTESVTTNSDTKDSTMPSSGVLINNELEEDAAVLSYSMEKETPAKEINIVKYKDPVALITSLLKSRQSSLSEEALEKSLSIRVVLPKKGHLAIMKFPGPEHTASIHYGQDYHRSESYLKTQNYYINSLTQKMEKSDRIIAVTLLPALLSPMDAGIPVLREAAVRLQADLLLAFRISSNIYNQPDINIVKAFCTFEAVLMDIRTGLIPYTAVVTRDSEQKLSLDGNDLNDIRIRAEKEAVMLSLSVVSDEITEFLRSVP